MTKIFQSTRTCFVCGAKSKHMDLASSNSYGSPDLDLRRPGMIRYTMGQWVQECPDCGYVARDLEEKNPLGKVKVKAVMATPAYRNGAPFKFSSAQAKIFYRKYLLDLAHGNSEQSLHSLLCCVWSCDDDEDEDAAKAVRKFALPLLNQLIDSATDDKKYIFLLIRADFLRRSHQFAKVVKLYTGQQFPEPNQNAMCAFQLDRAKAKDDRCYQIKDALGK